MKKMAIDDREKMKKFLGLPILMPMLKA